MFKKSKDYLQINKCTWLIWTFLNKLSYFYERILIWRAWISCHLKPSYMIWQISQQKFLYIGNGLVVKDFLWFFHCNGIPICNLRLQTELKTHKSTISSSRHITKTMIRLNTFNLAFDLVVKRYHIPKMCRQHSKNVPNKHENHLSIIISHMRGTVTSPHVAQSTKLVNYILK